MNVTSHPVRWTRTQGAVAATALILALLSLLYPIYASFRVFEHFGIPRTFDLHRSLLLEALPGAILALGAAASLLALSLGRRSIPRWLVLLGTLGAMYSSAYSQKMSHDFGHAIYNECSGRYGDSLFRLNAAAALLFAGVYVLHLLGRPRPADRGQRA